MSQTKSIFSLEHCPIRAEFLVFIILILIFEDVAQIQVEGVCVSSGRFVEIGRSKVVGLQVGISASANEVSSVRLKPGSQGWYEGISMND